MLIFVDTEFTDFDNPRLISIGLVGEDAYRWIYSEIDAEHWYRHASEFVLREVVPLLEARYGSETPAVAAARIRAWCDRLPEPGQIVCDSDFDWDLLRSLLIDNGGWPDMLIDRPLTVQWSPKLPEYKRDYLLRYGLSAHHALADAKALRYAYLLRREQPPEAPFGALDVPA